MRRRWLLLGVGALGLALLAGAVAWMAWMVPPDAITPEAAARITEGMTEEEVIALLGGREPDFIIGGSWRQTAIWGGEGGTIVVDFTWQPPKSRVSGSAAFTPGYSAWRRPAPSLLDRVRRLLPW